MTTVISGKIQLPPRRADDKRLNIAIATPAYKGEFSTAYVRSLFMLVTAAPAMGLRFSFSDVDYSDIVTSRNYLLSNFFYREPRKIKNFTPTEACKKTPYGAKKSIKLHIKMTGTGSGSFR